MKSINSELLSATIISSLKNLLARKLVECIDYALPCHLSKNIRRTPLEYVRDLVLMETTRGDITRFASDMSNENQVYRVNYGEFILNLKQLFLNERGSNIDDFDSVITQVQKEKIEALITKRFGDEFYRIFTFLSDQPDFLSVDQIKDALEMILSCMESGAGTWKRKRLEAWNRIFQKKKIGSGR